MPQLRPSWQLSFVTAGVLLAVLVVTRVAGRRRQAPWSATVAAFAGEFAVVMSLLGLWQLVGAAVHTRVAGATERGRAIHAGEAAWHLPSERAFQRAADGVPHLMQAADIYYAYAHLNGMALFVVWLWWRHREVYRRARSVIIVSTLACLVVQVVPVAPPRLLPDLGFVDTALRDGRSVYGPFGSGLANQLAAMPSVHAGWAVIIAWYVWWAAPRRWRWIGPLHAVLTVLVVVVTANHWWLDAVVAAGFVALAVAAAGAPHRTCRSSRWVPRARPPFDRGMFRVGVGEATHSIGRDVSTPDRRESLSDSDPPVVRAAKAASGRPLLSTVCAPERAPWPGGPWPAGAGGGGSGQQGER